MYRFWSRYTGPLIDLIAPRRIMEIGADIGWNTQHLLAYCRGVGGHLDIIDTLPSHSLKHLLAQYGPDDFSLHIGKSVDMIPLVELPDLVMLDGDHNWWTVYNELSLIRARAAAFNRTMPIILAHDCGWPYGRRDMYYNPGDLGEKELKPFAYKGILPGEPELVDDGINACFANALVEGGPENGVLTAIEDFLAVNAGIKFWMLPFFNGLGMIIPEERLSAPLRALIDSFFGAESLMEACKALEADGMRARAEGLMERLRLAQRTDALQRARHLLARRAERIAELEAQLAAASQSS